MDSLEVLSLGRNNIKKIEGLDGVADTLKELWISYNNIEKLAGIEKMKSLEVLVKRCVLTSFDDGTPVRAENTAKMIAHGAHVLVMVCAVEAFQLNECFQAGEVGNQF